MYHFQNLILICCIFKGIYSVHVHVFTHAHVYILHTVGREIRVVENFLRFVIHCFTQLFSNFILAVRGVYM